MGVKLGEGTRFSTKGIGQEDHLEALSNNLFYFQKLVVINFI